MSQPTPTTLAALSAELASAVERAAGATVAVNGRSRLPSTGIVWRQGIVVTADSTIEREDDITVKLPDGTTLPATLAGRDPAIDLAILKVDGLTLAPATLADTSQLRVGEIALALGRQSDNSVGASFSIASSVADGRNTGRGGRVDRIITTSVTMYPGFSGGPLIDARGRVIGMNTTHLFRSGNVTIPVENINRDVDQLLTTGSLGRGYLGLALQGIALHSDLTSKLGIANDRGLMVMQIESNGPGAQGGVLIGDIIISAEGTPIHDNDDLLALLSADRIGKPLTLQIIRGGALAMLSVTVGARSTGQ
jgi:S1-C subfamily serine protease